MPPATKRIVCHPSMTGGLHERHGDVDPQTALRRLTARYAETTSRTDRTAALPCAGWSMASCLWKYHAGSGPCFLDRTCHFHRWRAAGQDTVFLEADRFRHRTGCDARDFLQRPVFVGRERPVRQRQSERQVPSVGNSHLRAESTGMVWPRALPPSGWPAQYPS